MSIGGALLNAFGFKNPAKWYLVRINPPKTEIEGQFAPEDLVRNEGTNWIEMAIARREPVLQWVGPRSMTCSFRARFYNDQQILPTGLLGALPVLTGRDIDKDIKTLYSFLQPDKETGAPPELRFAWGDLQFDCVLEGIGGVRYDALWATGRFRDVTVEISLRKLPLAPALIPTDASLPTSLSLWKPVVQGDTYESLALTQYGSPLYGILLRQMSTTAFPKAGDTVRLPDRSYFLGARRAPKSYALGASDEAQKAIQDAMVARSSSFTMPLVV